MSSPPYKVLPSPWSKSKSARVINVHLNGELDRCSSGDKGGAALTARRARRLKGCEESEEKRPCPGALLGDVTEMKPDTRP